MIRLMHQRLSLSIKDLRYVGVVCKVCSTEVVLDMESAYRNDDDLRAGFAPDGCPTCGAAFDSAIKPALDRFKGIYAALGKLRSGVSFHVAAPGGDDTAV